MKAKKNNIKNRLGTSKSGSNFKPIFGSKQSLIGVHKRIGLQGAQVKKRLALEKEPIVTSGDARHKLIAKKRSKIVDARDRLAEIAKQGDARDKINKIKNQKNVSKRATTISNVTVQNNNQLIAKIQTKKNIQRKAGVTGQKVMLMKKVILNNQQGRMKQTGLGGKTLMQKGALIRTVGEPAKFHRGVTSTGKTTNVHNQGVVERYHPLKNNPNVVTIKNEKAQRAPLLKKTINNRSLKSQRNAVSTSLVNRPPVFEAQLHNQMYSDNASSNYYQNQSWMQQSQMNAMKMVRPEVRPSQLRITTDNDYMDSYAPPRQYYVEDEDYFPTRSAPMKRPSYTDYEDEYMPAPAPRKPPPLSTNIISRLDQKPAQKPSGYKVVVTNLHPVVTTDDVEELFSNIGALRSARIVRQGMAEVIYINEEDAIKSVEAYHNRQLDGRAMNVAMVDKKSSSVNSSPRQRFEPPPLPSPRRNPMMDSRHNTKSVLRAAGGSLGPVHQSMRERSRSNDVAPDICAIKEALFNANSALAAANQHYRPNRPSYR